MRSGERAPSKARRYLIEGRVQLVEVTASTVRAHVRGDGVRHWVTWSIERGWRCSCPSQQTHCSHRIAVGHVVVVGEVTS